ncbi:MAG: hypothetical protein A2Y25_05820 [Candidatus Melainabacteria bacterium GWF2_37_15]|nr:MAG: hypothetical protein A2Y25_05820 [Candidatus Melainabacteria bacterium GWF2_37_15]
MKLINKTSGKVLVENLEVADSFFTRMKGLLGRNNLPEGEGLHIIPCNDIHTFFMKFEFDAIFIDKKNIIRGLVENMQPGKVKFCFPAHSVIELCKGSISKTDTRLGDEVQFIIKS